MNMNRWYNTRNPAQGEHKRVLCVCSAGLLRSPSAAVVLSQEPFNFNTRAAGLVPDFALIPVDKYLVNWADEVVCMTKEHQQVLLELYPDKPIICLDIPDEFEYRDPRLMKLVAERYAQKTTQPKVEA